MLDILILVITSVVPSLLLLQCNTMYLIGIGDQVNKSLATHYLMTALFSDPSLVWYRGDTTVSRPLLFDTVQYSIELLKKRCLAHGQYDGT